MYIYVRKSKCMSVFLSVAQCVIEHGRLNDFNKKKKKIRIYETANGASGLRESSRETLSADLKIEGKTG